MKTPAHTTRSPFPLPPSRGTGVPPVSPPPPDTRRGVRPRTPFRNSHLPTLLATPLLCLLLPACETDRRIVVTSDPPGARVWLNDVEVGRTPTEAAFKFYGEYDVRLQLEGHEGLQTSRKARAPIHEQPGIDFLALLTPVNFESRIEWHFDLDPLPERTLTTEELEQQVLDRARGLRDRLGGPPPPLESPPQPEPDESQPEQREPETTEPEPQG